MSQHDLLHQPGTLAYRQSTKRLHSSSLVTMFEQNPDGATQESGTATSEPMAPIAVQEAESGPSATGLGWRSGVLVPVLLNIWGVIMFLRLGWVVGQAGAGLAVVIIVASNIVTTITTLSLCAICTNGIVKGGGAYFLISKALGPKFGGVIGVLFYVAQAVATSMYVVGFAESLSNLLETNGVEPFTGSKDWDLRVIGLVVCTLLLGIALIGVGWYAKSQVFLLMILIVAILSVIVGSFFPGIPDEAENQAAGFSGYGETFPFGPDFVVDLTTMNMQNFFTVFSVFFPAVTGIMAGANMSGDLKEPSKAIPKGTLTAIIITFISYVFLAFAAAAAGVRCVGEACSDPDYGTVAWGERVKGTDREPTGGLSFNNLIMANVSIWEPLFYCGVFAATLSSALASLVGAPRILQALAKDMIFPFRPVYFFSQYRWSSRPKSKTEPDPTTPSINDVENGASVESGPPTAAPMTSEPNSSTATAVSLPETPQRRRKGSKCCGGAAQPRADGKDPEPTRGYFLTYVVAMGCVLIGDLNAIAPLISNFFMISYALTNYACFQSSMSKSPGWRPSFKYYNPYLSLLGTLLCIVVMFAMDWINSLVSLLVGLAIFKYLDYNEPEKDWGPADDAAAYVRVVRALYGLSKVKRDEAGNYHVKAYRPQYLVMVGSPEKRPGLVSFVSRLYKGRGISILGSCLLSNEDSDKLEETGDYDGNVPSLATHNARMRMWNYLESLKLNRGQREVMMAEAVVAPTLREGFRRFLQLGGLSALRPNALVIGYKRRWRSSGYLGIREYEGIIVDAMLANLAVLVVRDDQEQLVDDWTPRRSQLKRVTPARTRQRALQAQQRAAPGSNAVIDLWWLYDEGGLAVLVPYLLTLTQRYKGFAFRVFTVGTPGAPELTANNQERVQKLARLLSKFRIPAEPFAIPLKMQELKQETVDKFETLFPGFLDATPPAQNETSSDDDDEGGKHVRFGSKDIPLTTVMEAAEEVAGSSSGSEDSDSDDSDSEEDAVEETKQTEARQGGGAGGGSGLKGGGKRKRRLKKKAETEKKSEEKPIASSPVAATERKLNDSDSDGNASSSEVYMEVPSPIPSPLTKQSRTSEPSKGSAASEEHKSADSPDPEDEKGGIPFNAKEYFKSPRPDLQTIQQATRRILRCGELIREKSSQSSIVFIALPAPNVHHPTGLLMARMEMLTRDLPPAVLVRGNNQPVLTFYS